MTMGERAMKAGRVLGYTTLTDYDGEWSPVFDNLTTLAEAREEARVMSTEHYTPKPCVVAKVVVMREYLPEVGVSDE